MPSLRVACRTPWGEDRDLVVLRGRVVVPRELGHMRALSWLSDEQHDRLAVTVLSALERETGAELGLSPYWVPIERWNRVARDDPWLPVVPAMFPDPSAVGRRDTGEPCAPGDAQSLRMPARAGLSVDTDLDGSHSYVRSLDRLRRGSAAVGSLLRGVREALRFGLYSAAGLACAYYIVAAALWLWALRDGIGGGELQAGGALLLVAVMLSAATGLLREHAPTGIGGRLLLHRSDRRECQPLLYTMLDAYRLGIALQLLALGSFVMF